MLVCICLIYLCWTSLIMFVAWVWLKSFWMLHMLKGDCIFHVNSWMTFETKSTVYKSKTPIVKFVHLLHWCFGEKQTCLLNLHYFGSPAEYKQNLWQNVQEIWQADRLSRQIRLLRGSQASCQKLNGTKHCAASGGWRWRSIMNHFLLFVWKK